MFRKTCILPVVLAAAAVIAATCGKDTPTTPSTPVVTISAPKMLEPVAGAQLTDGSQPVTLTVENSTTTGKNPLTYVFEVATDDQFTAKVYSKGGIAAGTTGKTSQQIDKLPSSKVYYWRARAEDAPAGLAGPWAPTMSFAIGATIRIDPPSPLEPMAGSLAGGARPLFRIRNSTRASGAGNIVYTFDISETLDFQTLFVTGTMPESPTGETSWYPGRDLVFKGYYWRAKAVDSGTGATSGYSVVQAFRPQPDAIDLRTVSYTHGPDISSWPITRTMLNVTQGEGSPDEVCTYFTRQGEWPGVVFYGETDLLVEGNQWYFAKINGQWYGVPGEWFRPGVACKYGQAADGIGRDSTPDEPMHSWQPRPGELVGYAVSTPARNYPQMRSLDERSQVVVLAWK
jgi:hypothetical protein